MDDKNREPSMEEILASIRKILSEDEEDERSRPSREQAPSAVVPEPPPEVLPPSSVEEEDDVFELTGSMVSENNDEPFVLSSEPVPSPPSQQDPVPTMLENSAPAPAVPDEPSETDERLVSLPTETFSSAAFSELAAVARERNLGVGTPGLTIEQIVREMLRPLLKDWLDQHLPAVVEKLVRKEIERLVSDAEKQ